MKFYGTKLELKRKFERQKQKGEKLYQDDLFRKNFLSIILILKGTFLTNIL